LFLPGLELSRRYHAEVVQPLLTAAFPRLTYSSALIGYGSDVIGCDDARSRDHMWGPRMVLFLPEADFEATRAAVDGLLRERLPFEFLGYVTGFSPPNPNDNGVRHMLEESETGSIDHLITLTTLPDFFWQELGWDTRRKLTPADWLTFSEHRLLTLTAGGVWHDGLGLEGVRTRLAYFPEQVWRYLLACQWQQIGQEEPFVGRAAEVGDEIGSRLLAAKMARCVMRLAFLLERTYAPYSKWFGTCFSRLAVARELSPSIAAALAAGDYPTREAALCAAYSTCARHFNALGLTQPVDTQPGWFFSRPFRVIRGGEIAAALRQTLHDPLLRELPLVGSANQLSDSTDLLESVEALGKLRGVYQNGSGNDASNV
jgi:hypothetical protein